MLQRRHSAASPVLRLVVTVLFVWACSSDDHGEPSVTTGGGPGGEVIAGSSGALASEGGSPNDIDSGVTTAGSSAANEAGNAGSSQALDPLAAGGFDELSAAGTTADGGSPRGVGGSTENGVGGNPALGGNSAVAGSAEGGAAAGASGAMTSGREGHGSGGWSGAPVLEISCAEANSADLAGLYLPCPVYEALSVCRSCHSNPPVKSVYRSYVTYQDIKPMAPQIYGVVKSGYMPWPPYTMSPQNKATLLAWLGKEGSCAVGVAQPCQ